VALDVDLLRRREAVDRREIGHRIGARLRKGALAVAVVAAVAVVTVTVAVARHRASLRRHYPGQVLGSHSRASQPGAPHCARSSPAVCWVRWWLPRNLPQVPPGRQPGLTQRRRGVAMDAMTAAVRRSHRPRSDRLPWDPVFEGAQR